MVLSRALQMTETEAWNLAGDLLMSSPLEGEAWCLAREALALRILADAVVVQELFDAAGVEKVGNNPGAVSVSEDTNKEKP